MRVRRASVGRIDADIVTRKILNQLSV
jgi:hypothetical protein